MRSDTKRGIPFLMMHDTWNDTLKQSEGMKTVSKCTLRGSLPADVMSNDSDMYLTYFDNDRQEERVCYKHLIRYVAFAPDFKNYKIVLT